MSTPDTSGRDASARSGKTCILVVDDELDIAEALGAVLEAEGYRVATAGGGSECLEFLRRQRPDLILLDIMMPGLGGFGVLRRMREEDLRVPVVMMSAIAPEEDVPGADVRAFLKKPFHLDKLLATVSAALADPPRGA